jgi:hypothetical protein
LVAPFQVVVGEPAVLRAEKDGHRIVPGKGNEVLGQDFRRFEHRALASQPGGGADHMTKGRQGVVQRFEAPDPVNDGPGFVWVASRRIRCSSQTSGATTIRRVNPMLHMARAADPIFSGYRGRCRTMVMLSRVTPTVIGR